MSYTEAKRRSSVSYIGEIATEIRMTHVLHLAMENLNYHNPLLDYDFVEIIPDRLTCCICKGPCNKARLLECCSKGYCTSCLNNWRINKDPGQPICPLKCTSPYNSIANGEVDRTIQSLKIYCVNKKWGCEWEGELREINKHLKECKMICKNCGASFTEKSFDEHQRTCKCKDCGNLNCSCLHSCPNECGKQLMSTSMYDEHMNTCSLQKVRCEYCQITLLRKDIEEHNVEKELEHMHCMRISLQNLLKEINDKEHEKIQSINELLKVTAMQENTHKTLINSIKKLWNYMYMLILMIVATFIYYRIQGANTHLCHPWSSVLQHFSDKTWYDDQVV